MSLPEVLLWEQLRQRPDGLKFRRQNPQIGYKLDFCCLSHRVAVEVDGEIHDRGDQPAKDERRDVRIGRRGFATLRIPARVVLRDMDAAITGIVAFCRERGPSTTGVRPAVPLPVPGRSKGMILALVPLNATFAAFQPGEAAATPRHI